MLVSVSESVLYSYRAATPLEEGEGGGGNSVCGSGWGYIGTMATTGSGALREPGATCFAHCRSRIFLKIIWVGHDPAGLSFTLHTGETAGSS